MSHENETPEEYTNRELYLMMKGLREEIRKITDISDRVGSLERWRSFILGGLGVIAMLIVPMVVSMIRCLQW